jgi:hypothetical protein
MLGGDGVDVPEDDSCVFVVVLGVEAGQVICRWLY